ncbi:MAG: hypothetical protein ABSD69_01595 [Candidatus Levyibacteriota bacterium]
MNSENSSVVRLLKQTKETAGRYRTEARERKRVKAQEWAAINIRGTLITRRFEDGESLVVTREDDGTIEAMIQMARQRRRGSIEIWLQYFTVAPDGTIMVGQTNPYAPREATIEMGRMRPFQIADTEAVNILIRRMKPSPR